MARRTGFLQDVCAFGEYAPPSQYSRGAGKAGKPRQDERMWRGPHVLQLVAAPFCTRAGKPGAC